MRRPVRFVLFGVAVGLLLPITSVASAAVAPLAVGGGRAFAAGRSYVQFSFSAHGKAEHASGHITLNWPPGAGQPTSAHGQILGRVTCLVVTGYSATAYAEVMKSVNPDVPFRPDWVGIYVTDRPNSFFGFFGLGRPPCEDEPNGPVPFYSGNIVVRG